MTDPLTADDLDTIEQRANAATEGPWEASAHDHAAGDVPILDRTGQYLVICPDCGVRGGYERVDAEFIAHARSDVPVLVAEVRRLRAMEQRVRELHEWYCAGCEGTDPECGPMCGHCYDPWPCATIAALDGGE